MLPQDNLLDLYKNITIAQQESFIAMDLSINLARTALEEQKSFADELKVRVAEMQVEIHEVGQDAVGLFKIAEDNLRDFVSNIGAENARLVGENIAFGNKMNQVICLPTNLLLL